METPLTPLDFARRAVKLYAEREAVVDGPLRFTYAQFCERCNRWGAGLASLDVEKGDRVATISPNTHQHLEQFYAIPRRGAVICPVCGISLRSRATGAGGSRTNPCCAKGRLLSKRAKSSRPICSPSTTPAVP